MTLTDYKKLWSSFLGAPPTDQQFNLWLAMHSQTTVRHGILKTAEKNLAMQGTMTDDHKVRFASKVMLSSTKLKVAGQAAEK